MVDIYADNIFKHLVMNESIWVLNLISKKYVSGTVKIGSCKCIVSLPAGIKWDNVVDVMYRKIESQGQN